MPLLKHPTNGRVVDVNKARGTILRARGYTEVAPEDQAAALASMSSVATGQPSAVQPQPPIDARENPPEPPVDTRPAELLTDAPIDTRPPNPQGPKAASVQDADASLDDDPAADADGDEPPAKSATKDEWVAYAEAHGVEDAEDMTKAELQERFAE